MKTASLFLLSLSVLALPAFDSSAWKRKNIDMDKQARSLQQSYSNLFAQTTWPIKKLRVPFELFPDGQVRTCVFADEAQIFDGALSHYLIGRSVVIERYDTAGTLDIRMTARHCLVDRAEKVCWIDGELGFDQNGTSIRGRDAFYSSPGGHLQIFNDVTIITETANIKGGAL